MPQRKRKPTSPGRRFQTVADFSDITKTVPERSLTEQKNRTGGRNNYGRKTARHRGGGHKRQYRVIDFRRNKDGVPAKVAAVEYDPNRSCRILLLHYLKVPSVSREIDILVTGLVMGGGSKALHELIGNVKAGKEAKEAGAGG